ncbi:zinc metalloprotease [Vairimorpha ceranae]|uniref:Zinc metalloprotease n=1 Tax=Vairimorpha ceranae TaxID=40302 RepID=A0A0F9WS01_9MICR|nr:zinc metalloprotease [Vairimorpha ceranae]KAF5140437.1 hypothetical protein G9O61_00g012420 [Vairimorpha ceranae]KKO75663.1 zinc metalloprotease [Vairimorpha ceranae]
MKNHLKASFFIAFSMTILVLLYEEIALTLFSSDLNNDGFGVPKSSFTYKLASEDPLYRVNMLIAVSSRLSTLHDKLYKIGIYTSIGCLILLDTPRLLVHKLCNKSVNFYTETYFNINHIQLAIANLFVFLFTIFYLSEYVENILEITKYNWVSKVGTYFVLYSIVCPAFVFIVFLLLRTFGAQLILAIYISLILKNFYEIFIEDDVSSTLKQVSKNRFSKTVQEKLIETKLDKKVFFDTDKSKDTNAALVGIENSARIEIYGDFDNLDEEQKDSILLHEIGHAIDHSLLKKLSVYFGTYFIELSIMIFLYGKAAKAFECEKINRYTAFVLLSIVYFLSMKDWIMMFYKMSSQRAEIAADLLTKSSGFGKELALSLYDISTSEKSYIRPTWLYNALHAVHPSIYDRIEYLNK